MSKNIFILLFISFTSSIRSLIVFIFLLFISLNLAAEGTLFVGLEGSAPPTYHSDMTGFPDINWISNYSFDVSGAAATPDGIIYLCEGAFTTHLYEATLNSSPQQICTISEDMSALAYGNSTLYGFSNYANPKGIYSIDTTTGTSTLVLDVYTSYGFRFFALDYNPMDSLFYGYTEYGASGLYSINIDTGEMILLTGTIPASNGQGRGLAVGDNTVYLTATRGDEGIPYFAYDISQGVGGSWVEFTNPYPDHHSTGGAAWIPNQVQTIQISGNVVGSDEPGVGLANCDVNLSGDNTYQTQTDLNGDFLITEVVGNADYTLEISHAGFETYNTFLQTGIDDIDLGTIELDEIAYPATEVLAVVNVGNTEVSITWNSPSPDERDLESYDVYRFLEINSGVPSLWELISEGSADTSFIDTGWILLEPDIYQYAVVAIYSNGLEAEAAFSNVVEKLPVGVDNDLLHYNIFLTNYPNPFNPTTTISFSLTAEDVGLRSTSPGQAKDVEIIIYNIKGQKIKTLYPFPNGGLGTRSVIWEGTDDNNSPVSSGIYFYKLCLHPDSSGKAGKYISAKKMILLR